MTRTLLPFPDVDHFWTHLSKNIVDARLGYKFITIFTLMLVDIVPHPLEGEARFDPISDNLCLMTIHPDSHGDRKSVV